MIIRDITDLHDIDLDSLKYIGGGNYGCVYKYGDRVLKVYHDQEIMAKLEERHQESFFKFLKELDEKKIPILVCANEVFKNKENYVEGYISDYIEGIRLDSDFGEMDINVIMNILIDFYLELLKIDDLILYDAKEVNLILGSNLKIIDLDLAEFNKDLKFDVVGKNLQILNVSIFRAIIRQSVYRKIENNLNEIVQEIINGKIPLPILLKEYIDYINKHYFEVKKVKDLRYPYAGRI